MNLFSIAQCVNSHNNSKLYRLSLIFFLTYSNFLIILCLYFILFYILTLYKTQMTPYYMLHSVGKGNDIYATCSEKEKEKENTMHLSCCQQELTQNIEGVSSVMLHKHERVL